MEDYTYELNPLGSARPRLTHAGSLSPRSRRTVRVSRCIPSVSAARMTRPASSSTPVREQPLNVALMDLGNRFRFLVNEVDAIKPPHASAEASRGTRRLEVPSRLQDGCRGLDPAGGSHHTGYSYAVTSEHIGDLAEIAGVEVAVIDAETTLRGFRQQLRNDEIYYHFAPGLGRL